MSDQKHTNSPIGKGYGTAFVIGSFFSGFAYLGYKWTKTKGLQRAILDARVFSQAGAVVLFTTTAGGYALYQHLNPERQKKEEGEE